MTTDTLKSVSTRLFAGCFINSEIRMHLNQSIQWKHAILTPSADRILHEVHFHGKDYFGLYADCKKITIKDLTMIQQNIRQELKKYCPDLVVENIKICIFPQVFIA